jgi:DegV family protein with EDD domain
MFEEYLVKIITDTTAGLPVEIARKYDITIIPQIVTFGEESYYEGVELNNAAFMAKLKASSQLPKTAAPPPELFVKEFQRLKASGEPVLCLHPSSEVSGTVRSANVAAHDFPGMDIRIIDTRVVSSPLATLVTLAGMWAEEGCSIDEVVGRINEMLPCCRVYFLVATLEYLAKGGRIGGAQALLGSMLQIKPILILHDGRVDQFEKERTQKRAVARLKEIVYQDIRRDGQGYLSVMHAAVPQEALDLASDLGKELGIRDIPILDVPPAIVVHGGPGILGVSFFV